MLRTDRQQSLRAASSAQLRRLVIWAHLVIAAASLFIYLSRLDLPNFQWWHRGSGISVLLLGSPVLLPYAISAGNCWGMYTWQGTGPSRLRVLAFIVLLIAGAVLVDASLLGAFGHVEGLLFFELLGLQAWAYQWGGSWIVDVI